MTMTKAKVALEPSQDLAMFGQSFLRGDFGEILGGFASLGFDGVQVGLK